MIKSRRLRCAWHVDRIEEGKKSFKILTGKSTRKRPPGKPRRRWENNVRMDLKEIDVNARNFVDSTLDTFDSRYLVNAILNLWIL
jgi:hypothetical protein